MKTVAEIISISLNAITVLIPICFSINIIFSLSTEERNIVATDNPTSMMYNVLFVFALSLIFNSKRILKLGTF